MLLSSILREGAIQLFPSGIDLYQVYFWSRVKLKYDVITCPC